MYYFYQFWSFCQFVELCERYYKKKMMKEKKKKKKMKKKKKKRKRVAIGHKQSTTWFIMIEPAGSHYCAPDLCAQTQFQPKNKRKTHRKKKRKQRWSLHQPSSPINRTIRAELDGFFFFKFIWSSWSFFLPSFFFTEFSGAEWSDPLFGWKFDWYAS